MKKGIRQPQVGDRGRRHQLVEGEADHRGDEDRDLLAGGLPADVEALVAGRGDFREIDRHAAEFDAGGEALHQAADQHDQRAPAMPMVA